MTDEEAKRESRRASSRKYYAANREKRIAWQQEYQRQNRDVVSRICREYYKRKKLRDVA